MLLLAQICSTKIADYPHKGECEEREPRGRRKSEAKSMSDGRASGGSCAALKVGINEKTERKEEDEVGKPNM